MRRSTSKSLTSILIVSLMLLTPLTAAEMTSYSGPSSIGSTGNTRTVDGWTVPGNGTILDGWLEVGSDVFTSMGNGTGWDGSAANANFSQGSYQSTTSTHFDGFLSLSTNGSFGNVDSFTQPPSLQLPPGISTGGSGVNWLPTDLNYTGVISGNANTITNGTIPVSATEGNLVVGSNPGTGVVGGANSWIAGPQIPIPTPISNFTFEFDHWYHINTPSNVNGDMDGVWVEYRLDNGAWTWIAPVGGYNNTISPNASVPNGASTNGTNGFPVWAKVAYSGWEHAVFELDNLTGINNASNIQFRFRLWTDPGSTTRPGWYFDNMTIINVGAASGYFHHGCYVNTGTCGYSNNAAAALQLSSPMNLSALTGNQILRTRLEWDLEGSIWDNFCVEMSSNNNTWVDISSTNNATTTACRSRAGAIPGSGYTIGTTTYGDETNAFVNLDLSIPSQFVGANTVYLRYRVDTDSSVTNGGLVDSREGLTLDRIQVRSGQGNGSTIHYDNHLTHSSDAFDYSIGGAANDWGYQMIGAGGLFYNYGFEDAPSTPPGGWSTLNLGSGDEWEYGSVSNALGSGPASWPSTNYGFAIDLDGPYDGSEEAHLFTPAYNLPLGASARLTFDQWRSAETNFDGGAVFISVNNGTFTHFDPVLANGSSWYDGTCNFCSTPLSNLGVFDGRQFLGTQSWQTTTADLTSYSGSHLQFRFTFGSDSIIHQDGWYLDNIGVEVDYFEQSGEWLSPMITLDDVGDGFVDVEANTPTGTWIAGSVTDSAGNELDGYENLSFPISLAGIDRDTYPTIKVQVNMGTTNPFVSPLVTYMHVGAMRYFGGESPQNGWSMPSGLQYSNGNWTNPTQAPISIESGFTISDAPIESINITGTGSGVTVQIIDSLGNMIGNNPLGSTINYLTPQPGMGVRFTIAPSGSLSMAVAEAALMQPADGGEIDVTEDGTIDWSFPRLPSFGYYGWQESIHSQDGVVNGQYSTSSSLTSSSSGASIEFLIPDGSMVTSGALTTLPTSTTGSAIGISVASSQIGTIASGSDGFSSFTLDAAALSAINSLSATFSDTTNNRDFRVVEVEFTSQNSEQIDLLGLQVGYELTENVTGLGQQMYDYHASELQGSIPEFVDIPLSFVADAGAVSLNGGIIHELMITNHPFTAPTTLYPDGSIYEIVTTHHHLVDNSQIGQIHLMGHASDGENLSWSVTDLDTGGTFTSSGSDKLNLLQNSTVSEVNGQWQVTWKFNIGWLWDDVDRIDWASRATNLTGDGLAPAFAVSGGPGKNAVENDLQIDTFEVRDQFDRIVTIDPNRDFYAEGGSDLTVSGTVRFQDSTGVRPESNSFSVAVNFSGTEFTVSSQSNGAFTGTLTLPSDSSQNTILPRIVRVGPASGHFGTEDLTGPMDTVEVFCDITAPETGLFHVLTSNGLLDANGHVWDPYEPLSLHLTVSDAEALGEDVTLHYWREGVDDSDEDGIADEAEYQTMSRPISMPGASDNQQVTFSGIDVSEIADNDRLSLYVSGTDWAGLPFNSAGGHGMDSDKATMVIGIEASTILLESSLELNTIEDYLLVGQNHQLSMVIEDANGIHTIDEVIVYLASPSAAPLGKIHIDPREGTATSSEGTYVSVGDVTVTEIDATASRLTLNFALDWDFPQQMASSWMMPAIHIIDDTQTVATVNNIGSMRWKLDGELTTSVDMMYDMTEPFSSPNATKLYLGKGDIFAISGEVIYANSGAPMVEIPDGLRVLAEMTANSITESTEVELIGAEFNASMSIPVGYPSTNDLPVILTVTGIPGSVTSAINTDIHLTLDSTPPVAEFPPGVLASIETDRMSSLDVRINVLEAGGMPEEPLTMKWVYMRGGLTIPGSDDQGDLDFKSHLGDTWTFAAEIDFTPLESLTLVEGDQIAIWLEGTDLAGNELFGEGTVDNPRAPQIIIRVFQPELFKVEIDNLEPSIGANVYIQATIQNQGTTMGDVNVTLVEELEDGSLQAYDSHEILGLGPMQKRTVAFTWEAWDSGQPDLYIMWDDDQTRLTLLPEQIKVAEEEETGGFLGSGGSSTALILGLLAIIATGVVIAVLAIMLRQREEWDDEEEWEDAEEIATKMLDTPDQPTPEAETQQASIPSDAPLPEQAPPKEDEDEWMEKAKELLPDWPDSALYNYRQNGWTVEQLVEWKEQNSE